MAKLKLSIEALEVETFQASDEVGTKGTVFGNDNLSHDTGGCGACDSTQYQIMCTCTIQPYNTCDLTCGGTCDRGDTCYVGCPGFTQDWHCPTNPGYLGC